MPAPNQHLAFAHQPGMRQQAARPARHPDPQLGTMAMFGQ